MVKTDVELSDGSIIKVSPYEAHTGQATTNQLAAFMERVLVKARDDEPKQPRWKVGWFLGHVGTDIQVLELDRTNKAYGTWRHSPDPDTTDNVEQLVEAITKIKELNHKTPRVRYVRTRKDT